MIGLTAHKDNPKERILMVTTFQESSVSIKRSKNNKKSFNIYHNSIRRFKGRNLLNSDRNVS